MSVIPDRDKYITEINAVPFVGIIFILMAAFMMTRPMVCGGETLVLPKAINTIEDEKVNKESAIIIAIPDNGVYYLGRDPITRELLGQRVVELLKRHEINDRNVYIKMSSPVLYGTLVNVLSELRSKGINDIGLITSEKIKKQVK